MYSICGTSTVFWTSSTSKNRTRNKAECRVEYVPTKTGHTIHFTCDPNYSVHHWNMDVLRHWNWHDFVHIPWTPEHTISRRIYPAIRPEKQLSQLNIDDKELNLGHFHCLLDGLHHWHVHMLRHWHLDNLVLVLNLGHLHLPDSAKRNCQTLEFNALHEPCLCTVCTIGT